MTLAILGLNLVITSDTITEVKLSGLIDRIKQTRQHFSQIPTVRNVNRQTDTTENVIFAIPLASGN